MSKAEAGDKPAQSPPYAAVLLISAAALAYEVLLMRLFSIVQWHHFAYMVISLALLGYGASGTFLTLAGNRLTSRFTPAFVVNAALFGLSAVGCFMLTQRLPFNILELLWDPQQWLMLLFSYLLLFIPFFFAANCICLSMARFGRHIPAIYASDLIGAGLGALAVIIALSALSPLGALRAVAAVGPIAGAAALLQGTASHRWQAVTPLIALSLVLGLMPEQWLQLNMSEYKALRQTLQVSGAGIREQRSGPLGQITIVENPRVPLRIAEGLSLNNRSEIPPQLGIFIDGEAAGAFIRYDGVREKLTYLDYQTSALPYHLAAPRRALILGLGGGGGILQALLHEVPRIEVVEINPLLAEMLQQDYASYAGWQLLAGRTSVHVGEARSFVANSDQHYDLIQISLLDGASAASGGVYALSENYLYTREAITAYLKHLQPGGLLAITRWAKLPPRDGLKLFATAIESLDGAGLQPPHERLALIRGWNTSTLLIKREPLTPGEIQAMKSFCRMRSFDLAYYPGISPGESNRYNILPQPYFYAGAMALLGSQAEAYFQRYKFDIRPATDNRPYFYNFFKWSTLPEILSMYRQGGVSLLEMGYPILVLTLVQAMLVSLLLVLLPLAILRRRKSRAGPKVQHGWRIMLYFLSIGIGFLFIEMAFIHKFILFLTHPVYSAAVILCGFLVFSGLGSQYAGRHLTDADGNRGLFAIVALLSLFALNYLWLLPLLFDWLAGLAMGAKAVVTLALIAPLAFCMGMPFPLGLAQVSRHQPQLVPWSWGVNGCASLISAILATLLALHLGFTWVILIAVGCYFTAVAAVPWPVADN